MVVLLAFTLYFSIDTVLSTSPAGGEFINMLATALVGWMEQVEGCAFAVGDGNRLVAWNARAAATLGWTEGDVLGRDASELLEMKDLFGNLWCPHHCGLHEMARRGEPI